MKKSKIVVSLLLVLLIVIQSMSVFAFSTITLGTAEVNSNQYLIKEGKLVTDQPSVGLSVYYQNVYSGGSIASYVFEITNATPVSVTDSVYSYRLPPLSMPSILNEDISVTAKVYDPSIGFTGVEASANYNFKSAPATLLQVKMDTIYNDIDGIRDTIYGRMYENNVRISMPFNTIADGYEINYNYTGDSIYINGQDIEGLPYFDLQESLGGGKCETVALSVYNENIVHNYNLDVFLNTPGTATVDFDSSFDVDTYANDEIPEYISGRALDADSGNVGIDSVRYSLKNSANNYLIYDFDSSSYKTYSSVDYSVYNFAFFEGNTFPHSSAYDENFTNYWDIPVGIANLPASTYTLTVFADDGADCDPITKTFTIATPTTTDPVVTTGGAINVPTGGNSVAPQPEATVSKDGGITLPAVTPDSKGNSVLPISADTLKKSLELVKPDADGVKTVKLTVPKAAGTKAYVPELPILNLTSSTGDIKFEISTEFGTVVVPSNMLKATDVSGAKKIGISIGVADTSALSDDLKKMIGDKPVLDLKLIADGKDLNWNNASAPVTVTVPYTLAASESNSEFLTVWYIDSKGNAIPVPAAKYNKESKTITFATTHFSKYALVYNEVSFSDISKSFAKNSIEVLVAKGITSGTGNNTFTPQANITRADFLVMLINSLGLSADVDSNFTDVKSTDYFYNAVGIAKKLGIASGTTSGSFDPRANITRQDMMVMAAKAMKLAGKLTSSETDLSSFTDASSITAYAKNSVAALVDMGIVSGSGTKVMPKDLATREQVAIVIYKIYNK